MNPQQSKRVADIEWTYIRDVDDNYAPAEKPLLRFRMIGSDLVSLAIVTYKETNKTQTFTQVAQIVVDAEPFFAALNAHVHGRREKAT